jgi:hypothetical protein
MYILYKDTLKVTVSRDIEFILEAVMVQKNSFAFPGILRIGLKLLL